MCVCVCNPQVVVSVGRSLYYTPGSITFVISPVAQFPVTAVAGCVAGGGVSLILFLVISMAIILVVRRRESVMRSQVDVLLMSMKTLAEEHKGGKCCTQCVCSQMCVCASLCACECFCIFLCVMEKYDKLSMLSQLSSNILMLII